MTLVERGTVLSRISWTGVIAGLAVGAVTQLALSALGLAFGAGANSLGSLAIGTVIWLGISLIISSFVGGLTAARAAGYLTPGQGRFNGLVTGSLLALLTTWLLGNALTAGFSAASGLVTGAATATAAAGSAAANSGVGQTNAVQALLNGLNVDQVGSLIAQADPELTEAQATAAARVVSGIAQRASTNIGNNLSNISQLPDIVTNEANSISSALQGQDFVNRLQRAGLSQAQAQNAADIISKRVAEIQQQVKDTAAAAERIARKTATTAAWSFLLALGLILGFATLGGGMGSDIPQEGATVTDGTPPRRPRA